MKCKIFSAFAIVTLLALPSISWANPTQISEAERLQSEGNALLKSGDFEEALERFQASYKLEPSPKTHANIIYVLVDLERNIEAIQEYDKLVAHGIVTMTQASRDELEAHFLALGKVLGFGLLSINAAMPGTLILDGQQVSDLAPGIPRRLPAGKHVVRLEAPGMAPAEETVEVRSGERSLVKLSPRKPFYLDVRLGVGGGGTTTYDELKPEDKCSIYCFPSLNVLVGARLSIPITRNFRAEIGADYFHVQSTVRAQWETGTPNVTKNVTSLFFLNGGIVHADFGMDILRGPFRWQWRLGGGVLGASHSARAYNITTDSPGNGYFFRGIMHARFGVSVLLRGMWVGIGLDGVATFGSPPIASTPQVSDASTGAFFLAGPDPIMDARSGKPLQQLGQVLLISPEITAGWRF
jgi:hypothetical protein